MFVTYVMHSLLIATESNRGPSLSRSLSLFRRPHETAATLAVEPHRHEAARLALVQFDLVKHVGEAPRSDPYPSLFLVFCWWRRPPLPKSCQLACH